MLQEQHRNGRSLEVDLDFKNGLAACLSHSSYCMGWVELSPFLFPPAPAAAAAAAAASVSDCDLVLGGRK